MAARVSAEQVKEVITTDLDDSLVLSSMVDTANLYVDTHLSDADHSAAMLTKIELYLAAHFVALTEERGGLKGEKMGDASEFLADVYSDGFRATRFGQAAINLDTSGILASLGTSKLKAQFVVV